MRFAYGFAGLVLTLAVVLYPLMATSFSTGSLAGYNGSPLSIDMNGEIRDCTFCHSSFDVNSGTGSVTIDAPATFVPGETISFTITVDNTTPPGGGMGVKQGFEVSVEDDAAEAHVGTLVIVDDANTKFAQFDINPDDEEKYVTHTSVGAEVSSWTVGWTAPVDAPETVTIYAAGNAANFNFSSGGDYIYTTSVTLDRVTTANEDAAAPLVARVDAIYPNPFVQTATVDYTLERSASVTVTLYDGLGRVVRALDSGAKGAGDHTVEVASDGLPAGIYFVEVRTPEAVTTRPLTLAR